MEKCTHIHTCCPPLSLSLPNCCCSDRRALRDHYVDSTEHLAVRTLLIKGTHVLLPLLLGEKVSVSHAHAERSSAVCVCETITYSLQQCYVYTCVCICIPSLHIPYSSARTDADSVEVCV